MPQMFPLFWFLLFGLAALSLIMTSSLVHFIQDTKTSSKNSSLTSPSHNWKW